MQVELKYFMFIYCIMSIFRNGKKNKNKNFSKCLLQSVLQLHFQMTVISHSSTKLI